MELIKFEEGKEYTTRSVCDSDCIIRATIIKRTAKTVWAKTLGEVRGFRVKVISGVETFMPWGNYSMSPMISAE